MKNAFVFGASGEIGSSIASKYEKHGVKVTKISRSSSVSGFYSLEALNEKHTSLPRANSVVWAQGANLNDSILNYSREKLQQLFEANVIYILDTLSLLLQYNLLENGSALVIVSSIWQEFSKENKLSYSITKSALKGLVSSLAADLANRDIRVNSILPGVVDTAMSHRALSSQQITEIEQQTPLSRLVGLSDVSSLAYFLGTDESAGINAQSVTVDGGWSSVRYV